MKHLLTTALIAAPLLTQAAETPGYDRITLNPAHRAELVAGSVWYPAGRATYRARMGDNGVFVGTDVMQGADIAEGRFPLVVFSHGSGGNMDNAGWLLGALAERGIMSVAVNHPGSTTGDSSPRRSIRFWERTADLTAALDAVLADPAFGPHVDPARIVAVGFSLGGAPALHLAGARFDRAAYVDYCARFGEAAEDCLFFAKGGVDLSALPESFGSDGRDRRISAAVAVEPAFTWALTDDSATEMTTPVRFVSTASSEAPWIAVNVGPEGSNALARIPRADQKVIAPAWHFSFLGLCKPDGPALLETEGEDPVCDDPSGSDRATAHAAFIDAVASFVLAR